MDKALRSSLAVMIVAGLVGLGLLLHVEPIKPMDTSNNLLGNPSFEDGWHVVQPGIVMPESWSYWYSYYTDPNTHETLYNKTPEFGSADTWAYAYRVHEGQRALKYFTQLGYAAAGAYQQVQVTPGSLVSATAWVHAWCGYFCSRSPGFYDGDRPLSLWNKIGGVCYAPDSGQGVDWYQMSVRVGVDPTGGTDANAPSVVWNDTADWLGHYDYYAKLSPVVARARGSTITFFVRSDPKWAVLINDIYWDDAILVEMDVAGIYYLPMVAFADDE